MKGVKSSEMGEERRKIGRNGRDKPKRSVFNQSVLQDESLCESMSYNVESTRGQLALNVMKVTKSAITVFP